MTFIKKAGEVLAVFLLLLACWTAVFFLISWLFTGTSFDSLPLYVREIITSFSGFFLFGLIMFGLSHIEIIKKRQSLFFRPILDAMRKMAQGNFNIDLSSYNKEVGSRNHPFQEIIKGIDHMAKELNEIEHMRQEFISNVSHEIQSPLTSIAGFAHALQKEQLSEEDRIQYLNIIEIESMRLSKLSDNLLKLTSLESDHPPFDPHPYRLDQQLRQVILSIEPQWRAKDIEMDVDLDQVVIHADKDLMNQVWINLIHNSIKFTPQNGTIRVSLRAKADDKVMVKISDNGIGMTEEVQAHIFERFYKADQARSRSTGGSGLGLSIVKKIIDMHESEISVESAPEAGTTFTLLLSTVAKKTY